jgi:glutamate--cysteine ligase
VGNPLLDFHWGLERETHRVLADGSLSPASHPSALRKPAYTRDFAETQLEIVTTPAAAIPLVLDQLDQLTAQAKQVVGRELLWPFSMPPKLSDPSLIRIAELGSDVPARRARLYRQGLALRYGRARQMICGVHVNVSFGPALVALLSREVPLTREERQTERPSDGFSLRLARNLYADLPALTLLLGASPVPGGEASESMPFAVSYRNSRHGYAGSEFLPYLTLDSVDGYLAGIRRGLRALSATFGHLGLVQDGRVLQLNGNVFQTEKEFYAPIRLRRTPEPGESNLQAIAARGIGHLELRFVDVDPFSSSGVAEETLRLIHLVLLDGLTRASKPRTTASLRHDVEAAAAVALRNPLEIAADSLLGVTARRVSRLETWAQRLDTTEVTRPYARSLHIFRGRLADPRNLPSARLARALAESGEDWTSFGVRTAQRLRHGVDHALEYAGV